MWPSTLQRWGLEFDSSSRVSGMPSCFAQKTTKTDEGKNATPFKTHVCHLKPPSWHLLWAWWLITHKYSWQRTTTTTTTNYHQPAPSNNNSMFPSLHPGLETHATPLLDTSIGRQVANIQRVEEGPKSWYTSVGSVKSYKMLQIWEIWVETPSVSVAPRTKNILVIIGDWYSVPNTCCKVTAGGRFEDNGMVGRLSWLVHCWSRLGTTSRSLVRSPPKKRVYDFKRL